ncbi:UBX domain-containing protein 6-like [Amphiura filiformis]|uniref:UBX domain-containing protein 6-like n=1 Tax=Amphiura filiformis TaxID=82378 RepID=UPI003B211FFC
MKKLEQFFEKKRVEAKFKKAGPGKKLNEENKTSTENASQRATPAARQQPAQSAQMAGQAALARMDAPKTGDKKMVAAKAQMIRDMEKDEQLRSNQASGGSSSGASAQAAAPVGYCDNSAPISVTGVFFKCSLSERLVPKSQLNEHIRECLMVQLATDALQASASMVHFFNKDKDKLKVGIDTICKYIDNVCNNPGEEKYTKIRIGNKAFQDRVVALEGTEEFLQSVGFQRKILPHQDGEEDFFVLCEEMCADLDRLRISKDILTSSEPVKPILDRDLRVFKPSPHGARFQLPEEFYNLTSEEIKREQQLRAETVDRNAELRTKAMRENEEQKRMRRYRYCLLRIRFPDGVLLQGTFHARDKVSSVMEFVRNQLVNDWQPFVLSEAGGHKLTEENSTLAELKLTPAAMLNFAWDATIMAEIAASQGSVQETEYLKPEVLLLLQSL